MAKTKKTSDYIDDYEKIEAEREEQAPKSSENEPPPSDVEQLVDLAAETLTGDIRDFILDRVKNNRKPWPQYTEEEQQGEINRATEAAERLVRRAVNLIASAGRCVMQGNLDKVTVKDGIQAVIKLSKHDENRHALMDSQGQVVLIVVAGTEPFTGEKAPATPDPDQAELPVDDEIEIPDLESGASAPDSTSFPGDDD